MNAWSRPLATLAAAAVGGVGLWLAGHWDTQGTGGYWAALGVVAAAGLLIGLAQLRSPDGNVPGMFLVAWLPIAVVAGWVLAFAQPDPNTVRDHVRDWSASLGIADVSHYLTPYIAVLAFAIGLVFGLTLLAGWVWQQSRTTVVEETAVTPAPYARREVVRDPVVTDSAATTAVEEPVAAQPVATETVAAEPVATEPVATAPAASEPVEQETVSGRRRMRLLHR
jgi:hypothetical protein